MRMKASSPEPICMAYSVKKFSGSRPRARPAVAETPIVRGVQAIVKNTPALTPAAQATGPATRSSEKNANAETAATRIPVS